MADADVAPFAQGTARMLNLSEVRNLDAWQRAFQDKCKDHRYYELIEGTLANDFEFRYLVLEDAAGNVRAIQPILFVRQNLIEGVRGFFRAIVDLVRKKFPRFLTMRVLMVGCAAGAGELDATNPEDEKWIANTLGETLRAYARKNKASLVVFKDFPAKYREALSALLHCGYNRAPSMPMTRLSLGFDNFEEYLGTLGYISRKSLRRKFRKTERDAKIDMEVLNNVDPIIDQIFPLYLEVHERSPMKFENLTREFFLNLSKEMPERVRFFIWRIDNRIVAFSLCLLCGDTIYDEVLGLDYKVALDLHLYFYTMRDVIRWAIEQKIRYYVSGPLNYDPKLHLGHQLAPLDLYVLHTRAWLNPIFGFALKYLEPTRHDPIFKKFPNFGEL
ncbi:MAG TPA: GNAT family N-acetyltransferase [Chthoniobacterales bacterium]|jgi:predicted N-acyltransferase|nr:GNAT family N-acetyltransferase [Chthoniobacterales bacterium]